jgi:hypothetical protein
MEQAQAVLNKILSNQVTAFFFVFACAIGLVIGVAGTYWAAYQIAIMVGAY